jgi:transposase InsO family protein
VSCALLCATVHLRDHPFSVIFDAGSQVTLINRASAIAIGLPTQHRDGRFVFTPLGAPSHAEDNDIIEAPILQFPNTPPIRIPVTAHLTDLLPPATILLCKPAQAFLQRNYAMHTNLSDNIVTLTVDGVTSSFEAREDFVIDAPNLVNLALAERPSKPPPPPPMTAFPDEVVARFEALRVEFADVIGGPAQPGAQPLPHPASFSLAKPVTRPIHKFYRLSAVDARLVQETLDDLIAQGKAVKDADVLITSPAFVVRHADGSRKPRVVFDFQALNRHLHPQPAVLPHLAEALERVARYAAFATLDLKAAFFQVPLDITCKGLVATQAPDGARIRFTHLPFGLATAPHSLELNLASILNDLSDTFERFVDDLVVLAHNHDELYLNLRAILSKFRQYGIILSPPKCVLLTDRVHFLGHFVSHGKIEVDEARIWAIVNFPVPATVQDLRSFLGALVFVSKHIPMFAPRLGPLYELTCKDRAFVWTPAAQSAFESIKQALTTAPCLGSPAQVPGNPCLLFTDASDHGAGAILFQVQGGETVLLGFDSCRFPPAVAKQPIFFKELVAIDHAVTAFRFALYGQPLHVFTDNHALAKLFDAHDSSTATSRRVLYTLSRLSEYDIHVHHIAGVDNPAADCISRAVYVIDGPSLIKAPVIHQHEALPLVLTVTASVDTEPLMARIRAAYDADPLCSAILQHRDDASHALSAKYIVDASGTILLDLPFFKTTRILVPASSDLRLELLALAHDHPTAGHGDKFKTYTRLTARFHWKGANRDVARYVASCVSCAQAKESTAINHTTHPTAIPAQPWEHIQIDVFSGLPTSRGFDAVLCVADTFTRAVLFLACRKSSTASQLGELLFHEAFIKSHIGVPARVTSDRAKTFTAAVMRSFLRLLGATPSYATVSTPQSQGIVERSNRHLITYVRTFANDHATDWADLLHLAAFAKNSAPAAATGIAPYEAWFGYIPRSAISLAAVPDPVSPANLNASAAAHNERLLYLRTLAVESLNATQDDAVVAHDNTAHPVSLQLGDMVFVHRDIFLPANLRHQPGAKAGQRYYGPFPVIANPGPNAYTIDLPASFRGHRTINMRHLKKAVHFEDLDRPQRARNPAELGDELFLVRKILRHRLREGAYQFRVAWQGYDDTHDSWQPLDDFIFDGRITNTLLREYILSRHLPIDPDAPPLGSPSL